MGDPTPQNAPSDLMRMRSDTPASDLVKKVTAGVLAEFARRERTRDLTAVKPPPQKFTAEIRRDDNAVPTPEQAIKKFQQIIDAWFQTGEYKKSDSDKYSDAFKEALNNFLAQHPDVKKKIVELLMNKKLLPLELMMAAPALVGIVVNKRDLPSLEIPLGRQMKVNIDIDGNVSQIKKVVIKFEMPIGSVERRPKSELPSMPNVKPAVDIAPALTERFRTMLPDAAIRNWMLSWFEAKFDRAGPWEEARYRMICDWIRNPDNVDQLPSLHDLADNLLVAIYLAAAAKRHTASVTMLGPQYKLLRGIGDLSVLFRMLEALVKVAMSLKEVAQTAKGLTLVSFQYPSWQPSGRNYTPSSKTYVVSIRRDASQPQGK